MTEFTIAERIWHRAIGFDGASDLPGDGALECLLLCHGYIMNGGVFHAADDMEPTLLAEAQAGYRYFGFDEIADLLDEAKSISKAGNDLEKWSFELSKRYDASIPDDAGLFARFEQYLRKRPSDFAAP